MVDGLGEPRRGDPVDMLFTLVLRSASLSSSGSASEDPRTKMAGSFLGATTGVGVCLMFLLTGLILEGLVALVPALAASCCFLYRNCFNRSRASILLA